MTSRRKLYAQGEPFGASCTRREVGRTIYGGGDGGSSSSSSANTTSTTNVDKRQVVDNGAIGVSSDSSTVNVSMLDNGAVNHAIDLVNNAGAGALDAYKALLATTLALESKNTDTLKANTDLASKLVDKPVQADASNNALKVGGLLIVGMAALSHFGKT